MRLYQGIRSLILTLFRKILFIWVRTDVSGNSVEALALDPDKPVCYVLQYSSLSSRLVLEQEVIRAGLPGATEALPDHPSLLAVASLRDLNRKRG